MKWKVHTNIYVTKSNWFRVFKNIHFLGAKHSELCKKKKSQYIFLVKQTLYFDTLAPVFSPKRLSIYITSVGLGVVFGHLRTIPCKSHRQDEVSFNDIRERVVDFS